MQTDAGDRRILVKLWYPASVSSTQRCEKELLWAQLDSDKNIPMALKLYFRKAKKKLTNSYVAADYDLSCGGPRILIYHHGLISFASENTMLMEQLASYGYTVVAVQHWDQLAEFQALQKDQPREQKKQQAKLLKQLANAAAQEKPELTKRFVDMATNTNQIVAGRLQDTAYIVKTLPSLLTVIPGLDNNSQIELAGVLGLSLGGAVATEYEKAYGPLPCVINIDGGLYGEHRDQPIGSNYLMLYSEANDGCNSFCLNKKDNLKNGPKNTLKDIKIETKTIPLTKHLNFHDIAAYYSSLKWLRAIGSGDPIKILHERNTVIMTFIEKFYKTKELD